MLPPNWVFLAVPLALLGLAYGITCAIEWHREQRFLHAVFDGDRIEQWRNDKRNRKQKLTAHHGRFYS